MSHGRYELHRQTSVTDKRRGSGLELMVFDHNTGRERPVATLSGGKLRPSLPSLDNTMAETGQN